MPFRQRSATRPFPRLRKGLRLAWHMGRHLDVAIAAMVLGGKMPDFKHPYLGLSTAFRPFQPLCCAGWDEREKLARMVDHLKTVERLGGILLPLTNVPRLLATLSDLQRPAGLFCWRPAGTPRRRRSRHLPGHDQESAWPATTGSHHRAAPHVLPVVGRHTYYCSRRSGAVPI